jgi:hypothetical protein
MELGDDYIKKQDAEFLKQVFNIFHNCLLVLIFILSPFPQYLT